MTSDESGREGPHVGLLAGFVIAVVCVFAPLMISVVGLLVAVVVTVSPLPAEWAVATRDVANAALELPWLEFALAGFTGGVFSAFKPSNGGVRTDGE